jgi:hypothetical protein
VSTEGAAPGGRPPVDWVDLVAGIRAGDEAAVLRLRSIFQGGIRFFLRRVLGQQRLESRQQEVLSLVIDSIRANSIDNPNRLASHVFAVLHQYMSHQTTASPHLTPENESPANIDTLGAIQELLAKVAAVDREALRRYYVDQHTSEQVCQALDITSARLRGARSSLIAAVTTKGKLIPMKLPPRSGNRKARREQRVALF